MMRRFLLLLVATVMTLPIVAQTTIQSQYVVVQMVPNHADWIYKVGEEVIFDVAVMKDSYAQEGLDVSYEWGEEMMTPIINERLNTGKSGHKVLKLKGLSKPGFMTLSASVDINGTEYKNYINVAFEPSKIESVVDMPSDFKSFWEKAIAYSAKTPLEPIMTLLPNQCTSTSDVYHIRFQNTSKNYIYGILSMPKAEGVYPAVLRVPGAGVRPYRGTDSFTKEGVISLFVGIHGIPVNMYEQEDTYTLLRNGALYGYYHFNNDNRDKHYYKRVITGMVKAVDFLATLPNVDVERIGVTGGSQGGMLAMAVGALSDKIKALVVNYPAHGNLSGYARGTVGGWPHLFRNSSETNVETKIKVSEYYDGVNFARLLVQPVRYGLGYNDKTVPPTSIYASYNAITAPKEINVTNVCGHWLYPEESRAQNAWLIEQLKR